MGGASKKAKDVVKKTLDVLKETAFATEQVLYDTLVKGESYKASIEKRSSETLAAIANHTRSIYTNIAKPLGINDDGFMGLKGGIFSKLGKFTKDALYDDAEQTVGIVASIAIVVVVTIFTWGYGSTLASSISAFFTNAVATAGVTSAYALIATYYVTYMVASFGLSAILSGILDKALFMILGIDLLSLFDYQARLDTAKRHEFLAGLFTGTIFDKMAGGDFYNDVFAGGAYFDATQAPNTNFSVGEMPQLGINVLRLEFPYSNYAGSYNKNLAGDSEFSVLKFALP